MKENISKTDNKIATAVFIVPMVLFFAFVLYTILKSPSRTELIKMHDLAENIHGTVDSIYVDIQNHNTTFAILRDKKSFPVNGGWEQYIAVGDSITKDKGSYIFTITKMNNSKVVLDYRDRYKKR